MGKHESETASSEMTAHNHQLKAIPVEAILLSGRRFKEYQITPQTFTKLKMWPDKYEAELRGISLARANGITVPEIVESSLEEWGSITYRLIEAPRLDQSVWNNYNADTLPNVGSTLAQIHRVEVDGDPNTVVFPRRNKYFLDDMRRRATIPEDCFRLAEIAFNKASAAIYQSRYTGFVHGDYGLQNIFDTTPLTVFDWEYSHVGYPVFDIGTCLSDMVFAVTQGNWRFQDYFSGYQAVVSGYKSANPNGSSSMEAITALRFLGHRVPPQFYLFTIEKLGIFDGHGDVRQILEGQTTPETAKEVLRQHGVEMDDLWGGKVLQKLTLGGYQPDTVFWDWVRSEKE